ncbi:hypothetical protein MG293_012663 [Ovis ammon polii]|uniref:Uncharacterized protein n=1 Tax=Ovis ammon polii TaxID=230172 RepID=A0AAD4U5Z8_OVIAM|nr:hypothetical protein MG293_012663 [Ovis ammon polii]
MWEPEEPSDSCSDPSFVRDEYWGGGDQNNEGCCPFLTLHPVDPAFYFPSGVSLLLPSLQPISEDPWCESDPSCDRLQLMRNRDWKQIHEDSRDVIPTYGEDECLSSYIGGAQLWSDTRLPCSVGSCALLRKISFTRYTSSLVDGKFSRFLDSLLRV